MRLKKSCPRRTVRSRTSARSQDSRLAEVLRLAKACRYEKGHTEQVTRLALDLFDRLQALHELGEQERFWLRCGGLLHDIGWLEGQKKHHKTSMRIILDSPLPSFSDREKRIIACAARYHRRAEPAGRHEPYGSLDRCGRRVVRVLSAILRVADSLDVMHEDRVRAVTCRVLPHRVTICCTARGSSVEELRQVRRKGGLFEKVFDRKLDVQWHCD